MDHSPGLKEKQKYSFRITLRLDHVLGIDLFCQRRSFIHNSLTLMEWWVYLKFNQLIPLIPINFCAFQIWRPITSVFFYPLAPSTGFHFLINCYFLYNYSLRLETGKDTGYICADLLLNLCLFRSLWYLLFFSLKQGVFQRWKKKVTVRFYTPRKFASFILSISNGFV